MINTLISATTALMAAMSPMNSYTVIEDSSNLPLLNPELKERKTVKLRLANGLGVLLISDPSADQSAASMCVGSGSWSDPLEYPGMAHFCEHMLFMGTKKYPSENEFFTYVSDYAGQTNAFTAPNRTVYMFSSQTAGFLPILDRFAHFFIDPLFNPANIAREMHAVDQEFAKNVENDGWREYMVFKETGNQDHPNRMFSTGNSETLGKIPQSALKKWHQEKYGAERMHLVIYSPLPMEQIQEVVIQTFSEVPKSVQDPVDTRANLGSAEQIGHISFIKPIQNRQSLTLSWELSPELSEDPTKSAEVLAYALRRGQKYSLYEELKEEQLIDTMSVRVDELGGPEHRFFQISLELTKRGIEQIDTAILRCFEAIAGIRKTGVPAYLFQEKNVMAQLNYQYQARQNPFDYISKLGDSVAEEDLSTYPRNTLLSTQYDPNKIALVASTLTPQTCTISLMAPPELTKVTPNRREKWLGAEYAIRPIPAKWIAQWASAKPNENIRLAGPNPFLPDNLTLVEEGSSIPTLIADSDLGTAYYVRSPEFGAPDSIYHIHILTPEIDPSAHSAVLTSLYIDHLTDILHPTLAAANSAGLSCSFDLDRSSIHLEISGYSEKAPLLLQEVAKQMPLDPPTREQFDIYVARHEKAYLNGQKELAARQAKELTDSIVNQDKSTKKEKLIALKAISYETFLEFHRKLFETTYLKALFAGNLSMKEAESAWLDVIHALGRAPFPKEQHPETKILHLPDGAGPYQIVQTTEVQGNAALLLVEEGDFTHQKRAAQEILSAILKEAFFNELRTKQKTGYIAQSDGTEIEERLFQYFIVQSNSHQPDELLYRFEQFIEEFNDSLAETTSLERFETLKTSLVASLKTRFRNLSSKAQLWDRLAFERDGDFEFVEKRISALSDLSYDEFIQQSNQFLGRENRKRLAILFEGKLAAPFAYQPIALPQIGEIATYAPRTERKSLQESASAATE
jgi:insulysin